MRARGPAGAWLIGAALLICSVALVAFARPITRLLLIETIERSGVPVRSFRLTALGIREAEFGRIALGTPEGPEAESARAVFTVPRLLRGRIDRLVVRRPKLALSITEDGTPSVAGLPGFGEDSGSESVLPLRRIDVIDGVVTIETPLGDVLASGNASIVAADEGGMRFERAFVRRASMSIARGTVSATNVTFREREPLDATLEIDAVDLAAVLNLLDIDGLSGTGELDGNVTLRLDVAGLQISGGQAAANGPGVIRYEGDGLPLPGGEGDKSVSERIALVRAALSNFHYTSLSLVLERETNGDGVLAAKLEGANPAVLDGHPFAINLRLNANFDKLAAVLIEGYALAGRVLGAP